MKSDIKTGVTPEECAELCASLKKCKSFEYNEKTTQCRPQRKYKPDVKCKNPNPDEVLFSLPDPAAPPPPTTTVAPSVPAAGKKVQNCVQTGGPEQLYMPAFDGFCSQLGLTEGVTGEECLDLCKANEECTDILAIYGDKKCLELKCPESAMPYQSRMRPDSKMEATAWYQCKEVDEERCLAQTRGDMTNNEHDDRGCSYDGVLGDATTKEECEDLCLASPSCDSMYWWPQKNPPVCASFDCSPGLNMFRPVPHSKSPAVPMGTFYKCRDGTAMKEGGVCNYNKDCEGELVCGKKNCVVGGNEANCCKKLVCEDDRDLVKVKMTEACHAKGVKNCPTTCHTVWGNDFGKQWEYNICESYGSFLWFRDACPSECWSEKCPNRSWDYDDTEEAMEAFSQPASGSSEFTVEDVVIYMFAAVGAISLGRIAHQTLSKKNNYEHTTITDGAEDL